MRIEIEGRVVLDTFDDSNHVMIANVVDDDPPNEYCPISVTLTSVLDENGNRVADEKEHEALQLLIGKKVRITLAVLEE